MFTSIPASRVSHRLTRSEANRAKRNWNYWFDRLNVAKFLKRYLTRNKRTYNNDIYHDMLSTGDYDLPNEAGRHSANSQGGWLVVFGLSDPLRQ